MTRHDQQRGVERRRRAVVEGNQLDRAPAESSHADRAARRHRVPERPGRMGSQPDSGGGSGTTGSPECRDPGGELVKANPVYPEHRNGAVPEPRPGSHVDGPARDGPRQTRTPASTSPWGTGWRTPWIARLGSSVSSSAAIARAPMVRAGRPVEPSPPTRADPGRCAPSPRLHRSTPAPRSRADLRGPGAALRVGGAAGR